MQRIFYNRFFRLTLLFGLASSAMAQEKPASSPPSAEVQAVIEELKNLRIPETFSFLKRVDPTVFAQALKTPEGGCAMMLASRWSTPFPDLSTEAGEWELFQYREKLSREFAQLPRAILDPLAYWRVKVVCPELDLPEDEEKQVLSTQDAFRSGFFLERLTPVQREAVYELHDLGTAIHNRDPGLAGILKEDYAFFTQWGPEKLHQVLQGRWSATEFLKALAEIFFGEGGDWKLSRMPSWFWQEIAEFTEGPNAYPTFSLMAMSSRQAGSAFDGAHEALVFLARAMKDEQMSRAVDEVHARVDAEFAAAQKEADH
ncbi:hypothetical protein [Methylacidimicrobium sp. B4]|uniref:hypothetical protein n=1 Tax=Methylacidimicrobium sp. B4 TaxID=2796139 RepID=UPI001A8D725C|nr:hypothetical protein [Methylacidimicrobium sp. B4]QSR84711.1 hypothetical protein MacB4_11075 [Methylacidimicrobium sp. B4]